MPVPVYLMNEHKHCGGCPLSMLCFSHKSLAKEERVAICARCYCVMINADEAKYVCTQLRRGARCRLDPNHPHYTDRPLAQATQKGSLTYTEPLNVQKISTPCTALWHKEELDQSTYMSWKYKDCVEYYTAEFNATPFEE